MLRSVAIYQNLLVKFVAVKTFATMSMKREKNYEAKRNSSRLEQLLEQRKSFCESVTKLCGTLLLRKPRTQTNTDTVM